jgi:hypothetical protein
VTFGLLCPVFLSSRSVNPTLQQHLPSPIMTDFKPAELDANAWYHVTEGRVDNLTKSKFESMFQITPQGLAVWVRLSLSLSLTQQILPKMNQRQNILTK